MQEEVSTHELKEQLLAATSPATYLAQLAPQDLSPAHYLTQLAQDKGLSRADVIRATGLNATFCYQIFAGDRRPGRDTCLTLALGLGASLEQTERLLVRAGAAKLYAKDQRDAVIMHALGHGATLEATEATLYRLGLPTLRKADS
jgi:hypothetical protein